MAEPFVESLVEGRVVMVHWCELNMAHDLVFPVCAPYHRVFPTRDWPEADDGVTCLECVAFEDEISELEAVTKRRFVRRVER